MQQQRLRSGDLPGCQAVAVETAYLPRSQKYQDPPAIKQLLHQVRHSTCNYQRAQIWKEILRCRREAKSRWRHAMHNKLHLALGQLWQCIDAVVDTNGGPFCAQGSLTCLQPSALCAHICTSSFAATLLAAKKPFVTSRLTCSQSSPPSPMKNSSLPSASSSRGKLVGVMA